MITVRSHTTNSDKFKLVKKHGSNCAVSFPHVATIPVGSAGGPQSRIGCRGRSKGNDLCGIFWAVMALFKLEKVKCVNLLPEENFLQCHVDSAGTRYAVSNCDTKM